MRNLTLRCAAAFALMAATTFAADTAAFKITFGVKNQSHGRSWSGGIRDAGQVRGVSGWHLGVEDKIQPPNRWHILLQNAGGLVTPKGIVVEIVSPEDQPVTLYSRYGDFSFVPARIPYGEVFELEGLNGDVTVERVPAANEVTGGDYENAAPSLLRTRSGEYWMAWIGYRTIRREDHLIEGGDSVLVSRSKDGREWSVPQAITEAGDHFRTALGEDAKGRVWCVYAEQKQPEGGNFDLYGRYLEGSAWSGEQRLTTSPLPDIFHRLADDGSGHLYLAWMGFRQRASDPMPQSEILMRILSADGWGDEMNLSDSPEDDWEPAVAVTDSGQAWVAWDSYRASNGGPPTYDVLVRFVQRQGDGYVPGPRELVVTSPRAEMRADIAIDTARRIWLVWEEGSLNWGKDTGYENPRHGINLRPNGAEIYRPSKRKTGFARRPRVAVRDAGRWKSLRAEITEDLSAHLNAQLLQSPRLLTNGAGQIRVILRHQLSARGRNAGHLFDLYSTGLAGEGTGQQWTRPLLLPGSTAGQDSEVASAPDGAGGLLVAVVGDGRRLPVGLPEHHGISIVELPPMAGASPETAPRSAPQESYAITHPKETTDVARVRDFRILAGTRSYKIIRGDLHRHSEISMDGATDGSIWDLYRYALNGASMDFFAVTDHNYGAWLDTDEPESANTDDVYQWWRTQKSADLFHVPGRFVPLYGYERSVNFPRGHVNIFHPRRGVFTYRVPKLHIQERPELIEKDATGLGDYLRETGGVGIAHTSGSIMGTDWNFHDDSVIPMVEIYQGDRNSYEAQGAPRAAIPESLGLGTAGRAPFQKGLVRNALGAGFRLGFIASSDHYSTHISYANLIVPEGSTTRKDIQDALQNRRSYASTDNIALDFRADETLQGGRIEAAESPRFEIAVAGTAPVMSVEIVKNNRVVYTHSPDGPAESRREVSFTFRDTAFADTSMAPTSQISRWNNPETGVRPRQDERESYYYVRVVQSYSAEELTKNGEVAWSSPIFVRNSR